MRAGRWFLAALALIALGALPRQAAASPAAVTEWELGAEDLYASPIAAGADGNLWLGISRYVGRGEFGEPRLEGRLDRITPAGEITELPAGAPWVTALAPGPVGAVWFLAEGEIGYVASSGEFTRFSLAPPFSPRSLTEGSDGNMWLPERNDSGGDTIVRITPAGGITRFPLPWPEGGPEHLAAGPDGALWFTELFRNRIVRMTTSGHLSEFPIRGPADGIAAGPDGNVWFTASGSVGRLTPEGKVTMYDPGKGAFALGLVAGPDGRLWFSDGPGSIGRISPKGRISHIALPRNGRTANSLAVGPDGAVWFSAVGSETCEGGGVTCSNWLPKRAAMFGRIVPGSLGIVLASGRAHVTGRRAAVRLRCEEGTARDLCSGVLKLKGLGEAGTILGKVGYRLPTDSSRTFRVRLRRPVAAQLRNGKPVRAEAVATLTGGEASSRTVTLVPAHRPASR